MSFKRQLYKRGTLASVVSQAIAFGGGIVSLWFLTRLLSKEDFGTYAVIAAVTVLFGILGAGGLDRTLLHRVSRLQWRDEPGRDGPILTFALVVGPTIGMGLALLMAFACATLVGVLPLDALDYWGVVLAPLVPIRVFNAVAQAFFQARQQVLTATLAPRVAETARVMLLGGLLLVGATRDWVAAALVISAASPICIWAARLPPGVVRIKPHLSRADWRYGQTLMLTKLANEGTRRLDTIMVGGLAASLAAADYAVAARLAFLTAVGNEVVSPIFTPRIAGYLERGETEKLSLEYRQTRLFAAVVGLLVAAVFTGLGKTVLGLFGDYVRAFPVLLLLTAAYLVSTGFGANGRYLNMAGHGLWSLMTTLGMIMVLVVANSALIPTFGAVGAALGTFVALVVSNFAISLIAWLKDRFATVDPVSMGCAGGGCALLMLVVADLVPAVLASLALGGLAILWLSLEVQTWWPLLGQRQ